MSFGNATTKNRGDWSYLWKELRRRTTQPSVDVPFVFYVFVATILLGCLGVWVELVKYMLSKELSVYDSVLTALVTLFPAIFGSSSLQLILVSTGKSDKVLVSFGYVVSIVAFAGALLISVFQERFPGISFWAAIGFAVAAIWLWWFTNGDDPTYKSVSIDAPSGGNTARALRGDTSGFKE